MKKRKNIFIIAIILFIIIIGFLIINSLQTKNQGELIKINYEKLAGMGALSVLARSIK